MQNTLNLSAVTEEFRRHLVSEERAKNTVSKYLRDVEAFFAFLTDSLCADIGTLADITKETVLCYKNHLIESGYAARSVNSMLCSLNTFLIFSGLGHCKVKTLKIQRDVYCDEKKELTRAEYERLCRAASKKNNERLSLILQTVCGTGIRVSELAYITVSAARQGEATVSLKGKTRTVLIAKKLQRKLLCYAQKRGIESGAIFVTRTGKPINRTNIWREMKALCEDADVCPEKVFPHNLRHLFARIFYGIEKDIVKLADILGHSSIETTRIYIISTGTEHRKKIENMRLII